LTGFFAVVEALKEVWLMNMEDKEILIDNLAVDGLIIPEIHSLRQIINRQYDNI